LHDNIAPFHEIGDDERIPVARAGRRGPQATIGIIFEDGRELPRGIGARNPYIEFDAVTHCNPDARRDRWLASNHDAVAPACSFLV
jgi:hypothetical protein